MKRLFVLAGLALALIASNNPAQGGTRPTNCKAPIIVSN
jgi:hypothetical protein